MMLKGKKTKVTGVLFAIWGVVAPIAGVPVDIVKAGEAVLGGLAAIFMREGIKTEAAKAKGGE
jgi:hypothetical protein